MAGVLSHFWARNRNILGSMRCILEKGNKRMHPVIRNFERESPRQKVATWHTIRRLGIVWPGYEGVGNCFISNHNLPRRLSSI